MNNKEAEDSSIVQCLRSMPTAERPTAEEVAGELVESGWGVVGVMLTSADHFNDKKSAIKHLAAALKQTGACDA